MSQAAFQYRAVDASGAAHKGVVEAGDRSQVYRQLVASGMQPVRISAARSGGLLRRRGQRVTLKDLSHFTYQFSVLTQARVPIVDGLRSISEQETNPRLRSVIDDIASSIAAGNTVTASFSPHRHLFGEVYVETLQAAEATGNMVEVLERLSDILECQYEINKEIKSALMYPACVVGALILAVAFLMLNVVPRFAAMFESRGIELPMPTQIVMGISAVLTEYWYIVAIGIAGSVWLLRRAWSSPTSRQQIDNWMHRIPLLGAMLRAHAVSRFTHVFGIALRSGVGLLEALEMAGNASSRPLLQQDVRLMREQVNSGGRLSDVFAACTYLSPFARRMLAAGEEAAEMSRMCEVVARHYDREVRHMSKNVTALIEPIMVVGLAAVVLVIALAIFLPMWNMAALIG